MLKKSQNWYQQQKQKSYGENSLYTGIIEAKVFIHGVEENEQVGNELAFNALNNAMPKVEELIPSFSASNDPNVYIERISLTPSPLQLKY